MDIPSLESGEGFNSSSPLDKVRIQSLGWSPIGVTKSGNPGLVLSVSSNGNVLFKLMECKRRYLGLDVSEKACLTDIIRKNWLSIPIFSPEKAPITAKYPSMSMCLGQSCLSSCTAWSDVGTEKNQVNLCIAWGDLAFLATVSGDDVYILGALNPETAHPSLNPISSVSFEADDSLMIQLFDGSQYIFKLHFNGTSIIKSVDVDVLENPCILSFAKRIHDNGLTTTSGGPGVTLSACWSPNRIYQYVAQRTPRCTELMKRLFVSDSVEKLMERILNLSRSTTTSLMDITDAVSEIYRRQPLIPKKLAPLDDDNLLRGVIERFLAQPCSSQIEDLISTIDTKLRTQLSFGLHHLHCSIDRLAASHPKARIVERKRILSKLRGSSDQQSTKCNKCGSSAVIDEDHGAAKCIACDHRFTLCLMTLQSVTNAAVTCNFCSAMNNNPIRPVAFCDACRIGVASRLI